MRRGSRVCGNAGGSKQVSRGQWELVPPTEWPDPGEGAGAGERIRYISELGWMGWGTEREEVRLPARFRLGRLGRWWEFTKTGKCKGETDLGGGGGAAKQQGPHSGRAESKLLTEQPSEDSRRVRSPVWSSGERSLGSQRYNSGSGGDTQRWSRGDRSHGRETEAKKGPGPPSRH